MKKDEDENPGAQSQSSIPPSEEDHSAADAAFGLRVSSPLPSDNTLELLIIDTSNIVHVYTYVYMYI